MVQISKLTKNEIKQTGFNNRSIEYTKMKNFGIDLNETSKTDRKIKKIGKTSTKAKGELETLRKNRKDIDEVLTQLDVNQYLKEIAHYKVPTNKNFKHGSKKVK
jgi:hypothetical protein